MANVPPPARPVVLTGFDLELECPSCRVRQVMSDEPTGTVAPGEYVSLHALPGRYLLSYRVKCWTCGELLTGALSVRSRSAPYQPERRRVWGG